MQNQLNEQDGADISIEVDRAFGPATKSAVEAFQEATEQRVDGMAGSVTMNLLDFQAYQLIGRGDFVQFLARFRN
ncbi:MULTISPECIES: peptidoglycan-binding domain-containing protein [Shouchella]|uniref:peptidoglycan-binding domain-containing protein n=1 Tax=Shouchella TaxID=2893057 RepID=UPI0009E2F45C|nr:peptidoglycan-binding protein [Shouchella clausii]MBU3263579.1 peptidoglycan-binding protein [Shouchella clausii]MBU3507970.1 peptidoglycan-binding protein [Shouchella clausii]MBU3535600.1 peptidoglycan-binding protein [Shouchella clausii]MBX0308305.1 peptidoglycan-binding protein [Shouchella clausii]